MTIYVPTWSKTDFSNHPHFAHCLRTWMKKVRDRKIKSVYVNCQFSVFPCSSRKWAETWSTGIPASPSRLFAPPTHPYSGPHRDGGGSRKEPGRELQCVVFLWLCSCVCVYVNFLFYRGSSVHMYRSLFWFSLWEKRTEKKIVSILMNQYGKQLALFLGSCPTLLLKTYFGSLLKCKFSV